MTKQISVGLSRIIEKANQEHALATDNAKHVAKAMEQAVKHAVNVGKQLLKAKAKCKHGEFGALFGGANLNPKEAQEFKFAFTQQQAAKYIKAAEFPEQAKIAAKENDSFNLNKVYAALSVATAEEEDSLKKKQNIAQLYTGEEEHYTPTQYIESARRVMSCIDLDPASNPVAQETVKAARYFTKENNGLTQQWSGNVWMNPPYTARVINQFIDKLVKHYQGGDVDQAVLLTNNSTDTTWFHIAAQEAAAICFTTGRISFLKNGEEATSPTNGQCFFYFGHRLKEFREHFSEHGLVMVKA